MEMPAENNCHCDYFTVCDKHQKEANIKLQTFLPQAVDALQKKGFWEGVALENVKCESAFGRRDIGVLSTPAGEDSFVLRYGEKWSAAPLAAHQVLSDAGIAPFYTGTCIADDGTPFLLEAMGAGLRACDDVWGDPSLYEDQAKLTAKLHQVQTTWYDQHRAEIQEKVPVMKDEPLNSAMWVMMRPDKIARPRPPTKKLQLFLWAIPRPRGQYAERMVTVHGDLHHRNIVRMPAGHSVLVDLEGVCVSSAAQDLVHCCDRDLVAPYLESMSGQKPSEEEIGALWLEAKIAEHVHFYLLRGIFWEEEWTQEAEAVATRIDMYIEHAKRFSSFVEKLRGDVVLAKEVLADWGDWRDECEAKTIMEKFMPAENNL